MSAVSFNTANQTYRQLMGNGLAYRVPRFQRDYSWTQDEWDDLWQDIQGVLAGGEPAHYMGYLVLQTQDNKAFHVIDGHPLHPSPSWFIFFVSFVVLSSAAILYPRSPSPHKTASAGHQPR